MKQQIDLGRRASLVSLSISQWYNKRTDHRAVSAVETSFNIRTHDDTYVKRLVPKAHLSPLTGLVARIRAYHGQLTLPWGNDGARILPGKSFFEYVQAISAFRNEMENLVEDFLLIYPGLITQARIEKGGLFDADDYPTTGEIKTMFQISTSFMPFPKATDFRLEIGDELKADLMREAQADYDQRTRQATQSLVKKFAELLGEWEQVLTEDRWRESLRERLADLVELTPAQNLLEDVYVESLTSGCAALLKAISSITKDDFKQPQLRVFALDEVRRVIEGYDLKITYKEAA